MAVFNGNKAFSAKKEITLPVIKIPKNVRQALNVDQIYENGSFKLEPKRKDTLYDRVYVFEDINYINKDKGEQRSFLVDFMSWLNSMDVNFKITFANEFQSSDDFLKSIRSEKNEKIYPEIRDGIRLWQEEYLQETNPSITTLRYLTITCRADSEESARVYFHALENVIFEAFEGWGSHIEKLDAKDRICLLQTLINPGKPEEQEFISSIHDKRDWKNDILPKSIRQYKNFMEMGDTYVTVLFGSKYKKSIDSDSFIRSLTDLSYPSFVTLDFAPVETEIVNDKLTAAHMNTERQINEDMERKTKAGQIVYQPSYVQKKRKKKIENYVELIAENDEKGYFLNLLVVLTAPDEDTLAERVEEIRAIGKKENAVFETCDFRQLKAWNTALPIGGRQVDYMRFFLTSSLVAFQPYHAQDVIEPGGQLLGFNKTTKHFIVANRKSLPNPHGLIVGLSGMGKSMLIKLTEISQTLLATDDDIMIVDPQNEFQDIINQYGGTYYDLTPKSGIFLNGFEVSQEVFTSDQKTKRLFIARQTEYAKSLCAAVMKNIIVTQEHDSIISRCTERMFKQVFSQKKLTHQPTLKWLRNEIKVELEKADNEHDRELIRSIYNCLEEYTEGSCDMLAYPTNIKFSDRRLIGFGMANVPENNWEAVMDTVLHYLSSRMEDNKQLQKATHFVIDEAQIVSKKPGSADVLNNAVITYRKFGGIVTLAMQNVTAALGNPKLVELFQNCAFKCFLDQGGVDAQELAEIQNFTTKEYQALGTGKPGEGVIVWNKKVILFSAVLNKENPLYKKYTTNFHETAADRQKDIYVQNSEKNSERQEVRSNILKLAQLSTITIEDVTFLLKMSESEVKQILIEMTEEGLLTQEDGKYKVT